MDSMFDRARQAMEMALERSKEQARQIALEASKRADKMKDMALDKVRVSLIATPDAAAAATAAAGIDEEEYRRYGITPELRDFVQGMTIDTFRDFPMEDEEMAGCSSEDESYDILSPWKERHALLVLSAVPQISEFRYKLCPKHIKEKRFWRIYFTLVDGHLAKYTREPSRLASGSDEHTTKTPDATVPLPAKALEATPAQSTAEDEDLDNYLLGALGESDDDDGDEHRLGHGGDDGSLDAEFEQLVKDAAMDSDTEKL